MWLFLDPATLGFQRQAQKLVMLLLDPLLYSWIHGEYVEDVTHSTARCVMAREQELFDLAEGEDPECIVDRFPGRVLC